MYTMLRLMIMHRHVCKAEDQPRGYTCNSLNNAAFTMIVAGLRPKCEQVNLAAHLSNKYHPAGWAEIARSTPPADMQTPCVGLDQRVPVVMEDFSSLR
jgi:hypothetical protein